MCANSYIALSNNDFAKHYYAGAESVCTPPSLQHLPVRESYVSEHTASPYTERFTFTGKERDEETGYTYHGARYYDASLMCSWFSVDPLSDKYPSMSPYNYCAWNPVKLVDEDGKEFNEAMECYAKRIESHCQKQIDALNSKINNGEELTDKERYQLTEFHNTLTEIQKLRKDKSTMYCLVFSSISDGSSGITSYSGKALNNWKKQDIVRVALNMTEDEGNTTKGMYTLAHELKHCYQFYNRETYYLKSKERKIDCYNSPDLERAAYERGALFGCRLRWEDVKNNDCYKGLIEQTEKSFLMDHKGWTMVKHCKNINRK